MECYLFLRISISARSKVMVMLTPLLVFLSGCIYSSTLYLGSLSGTSSRGLVHWFVGLYQLISISEGPGRSLRIPATFSPSCNQCWQIPKIESPGDLKWVFPDQIAKLILSSFCLSWVAVFQSPPCTTISTYVVIEPALCRVVHWQWHDRPSNSRSSRSLVIDCGMYKYPWIASPHNRTF